MIGKSKYKTVKFYFACDEYGIKYAKMGIIEINGSNKYQFAITKPIKNDPKRSAK